jgi:hypothetical protein
VPGSILNRIIDTKERVETEKRDIDKIKVASPVYYELRSEESLHARKAS